jgi:hypothetical protein
MDSSACSAADHCPFHRKDLSFFSSWTWTPLVVAVQVSGIQQDTRQGILLGFVLVLLGGSHCFQVFERVPFHPCKQPLIGIT